MSPYVTFGRSSSLLDSFCDVAHAEMGMSRGRKTANLWMWGCALAAWLMLRLCDNDYGYAPIAMRTVTVTCVTVRVQGQGRVLSRKISRTAFSPISVSTLLGSSQRQSYWTGVFYHCFSSWGGLTFWSLEVTYFGSKAAREIGTGKRLGSTFIVPIFLMIRDFWAILLLYWDGHPILNITVIARMVLTQLGILIKRPPVTLS